MIFASEDASRELTDEDLSVISGGTLLERCPNGVSEMWIRILGKNKNNQIVK